MKNLRQLLVFIKPLWRALVVCAVLTGVLTLLGMAPPLLMSRLINRVARDGEWGIFPLVMTLLFLVPVLRALVNIANGIIVNNMRLGFVVGTRTSLYRHLLYLSLNFYDEMPIGSLTQRLMTDVVNIASAITTSLIELLSDVVTILFAVVVMLWLSWPLSLLTLALLPCYYFNYRFFSQRIKETNVQLRGNMDHISSMLQERLNAHELIQSYGQEKAESFHFRHRQSKSWIRRYADRHTASPSTKFPLLSINLAIL